MAYIDEHCQDCVKALGEEFREVHEYLDEFAKTMGYSHRVKRHHEEGVEEVRKKWGDRAASAAVIHIKRDCYGEVPTVAQAKMWDVLPPWMPMV